MSDYQLLAERLTRGHRVHYKALREEAADAIIALQADLTALRAHNAHLENACNMLSLDRQELQERLAGYEDAPVRYVEFTMAPELSAAEYDEPVSVIEPNDPCFAEYMEDAISHVDLIVKPAKEGTKI